jgi:hypothetical protein
MWRVFCVQVPGPKTPRSQRNSGRPVSRNHAPGRVSQRGRREPLAANWPDISSGCKVAMAAAPVNTQFWEDPERGAFPLCRRMVCRANGLALDLGSCKICPRANVLEQIGDFGEAPPLAVFGQVMVWWCFWGLCAAIVVSWISVCVTESCGIQWRDVMTKRVFLI